MPINKEKMKSMTKQYGSKKGKQVYYALENKRKAESKIKKKKK